MTTGAPERPRREEERRTYWPRYGPAVPPPDFADDRVCGNCGYHLRGLPYNTACPECGSEGGLSPSDEPLPFDEKQTLFAYFATLGQVLVEPQEFGSQVWRYGHLRWWAARRFRRINMTIAFACFGIVIFILARDAADETVALATWPLCMIAVAVGLREISFGRLRFLESERLLPRDPQRAKALISYLSASLALAPLHLPALYASRAAIAGGSVGAAALVHAFVLLVQFLLVSPAEAHYLWQLVEMPKAQARMMGLFAAAMRLLAALRYCVALPAMFVYIGQAMMRS